MRYYIKKLLPNPEKIRQQKVLRIFGNLLQDNNLWHLNRRSARGAFAVGLFWACIPMPFQMVASAAVAIPLRVNLPLSVALVWVTNPLTMPFVFYLSYLLGTVVLNTPVEHFAFEASWAWFIHSLESIGKPFITGCILMAVTASITGYFMVDWLWRLSVRKAKRNRSRKEKNKTLPK